jgi:hypothetical protein
LVGSRLDKHCLKFGVWLTVFLASAVITTATTATTTTTTTTTNTTTTTTALALSSSSLLALMALALRVALEVAPTTGVGAVTHHVIFIAVEAGDLRPLGATT